MDELLPYTGLLCSVDELAVLTLQKSHSLSALNVYAVPALTLNIKQTDELNVSWNSVIPRLMFGYRTADGIESVKAVLMGLGRLSIKH